MSWYATSWQHMEAVRAGNPEMGAAVLAKLIDTSYPFSQRSGWAYKAWLDARRDFFRKHNLPLRGARKPPPDLLEQRP